MTWELLRLHDLIVPQLLQSLAQQRERQSFSVDVDLAMVSACNWLHRVIRRIHEPDWLNVKDWEMRHACALDLDGLTASRRRLPAHLVDFAREHFAARPDLPSVAA
jgi:hypothetical protein